MPKQPIFTSLAPAPVGPYCQAVRVGPLLFVSGQIPVDRGGLKVTGGVTKETEQVLENLKAVIEAAGASLDHVVKTTVFLTDMGDFKFMNQVYEKYFQGVPPARSTVKVAGLPRDSKVEIEAMCVVG